MTTSTAETSTAELPDLPEAAVPHEVTSFVGRRRERGEIRQLLAEARLVTLTGLGGIGKTRLALQTAAELRRAFADGVYFVSLAAVADPELVAQAVAGTLGLQARARRPTAGSLAEYLRTKDLLLVLDNCEHVIDAAAELASVLLRRCSRLRLLATSREPLRTDGETVHPVPPLTVPSDALRAEAGDGAVEQASTLLQFESVGLFVDRARAVVPAFELTAANSAAVAEICAKLEGIPLAIELAAVRLRAMSPAELASNLTGHWALLTRGSRTAPDRQRTMANCIEWSYQLCSDAERDVWGALSVFSGGFELDAAEAVCRGAGMGAGGDAQARVADDFAAPSAGGDEPFADVLAALVDKSIVVAREQEGRMRFRLLPPIRHRGLRRLADTGKLTAVRRRHRDWYVEQAVRMHRDWVSPRQAEWIRRMRLEQGNLQTALGFCCAAPGEAEPGLAMGANLLEFGLAEGLFHEGSVWLGRLLSLAPAPTLTRALALRTACWWAAAQGDLASSLRLLVEGQQVADEVGAEAETLFSQTAGFVALFSGDAARAIELFAEALPRFRAEGDVGQVTQTLYLLQLAYVFMGNFDQALDCNARCLEITEPVGEAWSRAYSTWIAGFTHWLRRDVPAAVQLYRRSLAISRHIDDPVGIGLCLEGLAWILAASGEPIRAAVLLGAARKLWERIETSTAALAGLFVHHQDAVAAIAAALPASSLDGAYARGRALSQSEAVRFALGEEPAVPVPAQPPRTVGAVRQGPAVVASRAGRHGRSPAPVGVLTRREREIAALVARGLSNRDIASTLVISKRTAETHVENILGKLGFTSRNQIIVWMADHPDAAAHPAHAR
jgi:non-specific serine/threonine protein kinase